MCLILIFASLQNDGTDYFLSWFWGEYFINVLSPQLICLLLTFFVASSQNLLRWLTVEIIFLLLISPMAERFVWIKKPDFPIDQIWGKIRWPFTILYQNGEWSGDIQGGLQMEPGPHLCTYLLAGGARTLVWEGRIRASAEEPRKEFCFTLDDGFQVKAVTLEADRIQPSFEQKGNLLSITLDRAVEEVDFTIRYAGHHEVYYAHRQGAI